MTVVSRFAPFKASLTHISAPGQKISLGKPPITTPTERKMRISQAAREVIERNIEAVKKDTATIISSSFFAQEDAALNSLNNGTESWNVVNAFVKSIKQVAITSGETSTSLIAMKTKQTIAQAIFLADKSLSNTASLLSLASLDANTTAINDATTKELAAIKDALEAKATLQTAVGIQDASLFLSVAKPQAIADCLITTTGQLNLGLANPVLDALLDDEDDLPYEQDIVRVITSLRGSVDLRNQLMQVQKPGSVTYDTNNIIRMALNMNATETVTDTHARRAVLSALMTNLRQGPVGSCFATYFCIQLLELGVSKCINDFAMLIKNDEISRNVAGQKKDFNYVLDISDDDVKAVYVVTKEGTLTSSGKKIWESKGIRHACTMMGIADDRIKDTVASAVTKLTSTGNKLAPIDLIFAIATTVGGDSDARSHLFALGKTAFSSETNHPLLRAWETAIASMAEASPDHYIRARISDCAIQATLQGLNVKKPKDAKLAKRVESVFRDTLNKNMTVRFDPSVATEEVSGDGHSTEGAFIIYEDEATTTSTKSRAINSPDKFQAFMLKNLKITNETIQSESLTKKDRTALSLIIDKITKFVTKDNTFLKLVLTNYDPDNRRVKDPVNNWQKLEHTPWVDKSGNDNLSVFTTYFGLSTAPTVSYTPKNMQDLLVFWLDFAKKMQQKYKYLDNPIAGEVFPCDTPTHAFSSLVEHPSIIPAVRDSADAKTWVGKLAQKGLLVANSPISDSARKALLSYVVNDLFDGGALGAAITAASAKFPAGLSIASFRSKLVDAIGKNSTASSGQLSEVAGYIDIALMNMLTPEQKKNIPLIHFADTNWNNGVNDIHFCAFFNPGNQTFSIGTVNDDDTGLKFTDPYDWVIGQQWRFFEARVSDFA